MQIEVHSYKRCLFQLYGLSINRYFVCVARDIYDKMKADLRLMKEEMQRIETSRTPKVRVIVIIKRKFSKVQYYYQFLLTDCSYSGAKPSELENRLGVNEVVRNVVQVRVGHGSVVSAVSGGST